MNQSTSASSANRSVLADVFGVLADAQTYKNLLYLILAFPLGIAYNVVLMTGLALGVGLSVILVGIGILIGAVIGLRYIADFERKLANRLLGTAIATPDDLEQEGDGIVGTVTAYLRAPSTWRGLGFLFLKFWIGIISFVLLVTFLGTAIELVLMPVYPDGAMNIQIANQDIAGLVETDVQRAIAVPVGALLGLVALHVLNAFARANATIASSLLGPGSSGSGGQQNQAESSAE